jgi:O-6-methylguanine DNA methyltransferase
MNNNVYVWQNTFGWNAVEWSNSGLTALRFWLPDRNAAARVARSASLEDSPSFARNAARLLNRYFDGARVNFGVLPVDMSGGSSFQISVWTAAREIPFGRTVSYGEAARMAGSPGAARATGTALGANPVPVIVPCHRVIRSDGSIGGFSIGVDIKTKLLALERR